MQFYYGEKLPLRLLDEAEFWKQQESEHTVVIRELVRGLEQHFVQELKQWEMAFTRTHGAIVRFIETYIRVGQMINLELYRQVSDLIRYCMQQSLAFISFLDRLSAESTAISGNPTAKVVLNHIRRESEYFVGIAQTILYATPQS
jgi:hypothetical protein